MKKNSIQIYFFKFKLNLYKLNISQNALFMFTIQVPGPYNIFSLVLQLMLLSLEDIGRTISTLFLFLNRLH